MLTSGLLKNTLRRSFGAANVSRNAAFKILGDSDLSFFESILDKNQVITDADEISPSNMDWTKKFVGQSKLMLKPKSNDEVAAVLKYCQ